jgi:cytochrome c551/c552
VIALSLWVIAGTISIAGDSYVTYNNRPTGTPEEPLILRTFFPDPGLGREVLANHDLGHRARKYRPGKGDVIGFDDPIRGIPAAIGVSFGPTLSYCWDTSECRLLYAWQGGFLNMENYWGKPASGGRKSFGYLPELDGPLIYLTRGSPPLAILDDYTSAAAPRFRAMHVTNGVPEFEYTIGAAAVRLRIVPGRLPMSIEQHYTISGVRQADYFESGYRFTILRKSATAFTAIIKGRPDATDGSAELPPDYPMDKPNAEWGKALYSVLGCFACHSTDGTRGHGPTFMNLFGGTRKIAGHAEAVTADAAYVRESILNPTAKVVDGFPPGYMPVYEVDDDQIQSLILFLKTLNFE